MPIGIDDKEKLTPRQRHVSFFGDTCLLPNVPIVGWVHYLDVVPGGLSVESHDSYEFHLLIRGTLHWVIDGVDTVIPANSVVMTRPGELHGSHDSNFEPCELYWIQVRVDEPPGGTKPADPNLATIREAIVGMKHRVFPCATPVRNLFGSILREHQVRGPFSRLMALSNLYQLILHFRRDHDQFDRHNTSQHYLSEDIKRAAGVLRESFDDPPLTDQLARAFSMSPSQFRSRFRREIGMSPYEYLTHVRIEHAKELLGDSSLSVTQIAMRLGFSSSQNFASRFKGQTGYTPSDYRRKNIRDL
jgi:AraC-like DNA-binding protein